MCLPVAAALSSSEVSGAAFKLYACYCAHREGFEVSIKSEQIHTETGIGTAYISTLKFELLKAGWIGLSKITAKGVVPMKGFEGAAEHIRTERKLSKIEGTSDKGLSNIERKVEKVSKSESPAKPPEKLSNIERMLSDDVSKIEGNQPETFENQKKAFGTPVAPLSAETTSKVKSFANAHSAREGKKPELVELPEWLPPEVWGEWEQFNRERRKPLPPTTVKVQIRQLAEFRARGMPPEKVIAQSIARNWQGLFELKEQSNHAQSGPHRNGDRPKKPGLAEQARATAEYFGIGRKAGGAG